MADGILRKAVRPCFHKCLRLACDAQMPADCGDGNLDQLTVAELPSQCYAYAMR